MRQAVPVEQKRKLIDLIIKGKTVLQAAMEAGVNEQTARSYWRRWAEQLGYNLPDRLKIVSDEVKRDIVAMRMAGQTLADTAAKHGLGETYVQQHWREWASQIGIEPPEKKKLAPKSRRPKKEEIEPKRRAALLKNQGWRTEDVVEVTGLKAKEIEANWRRWGEELGIELVKPMERERPEPYGKVITRKATLEELAAAEHLLGKKKAP